MLLPDAVRTRLSLAAERLRSAAPDVAWVAPENYHLTLKFLGAVDEARLGEVHAAVAAAASTTPPFTLTVRGLGAFPSATRARVLWAGVDDGGHLAPLAAAVDRRLAGLGFPAETRPLSAHVTIGRVREPRRRPRLAAALADGIDAEFGGATVAQASVMRSDLSPRGARYTELAACPLGARV